MEPGRAAGSLRGWPLTVWPRRVVSLPYTSHGLQMTPFGQSVRLVAKRLELELVVVWGPGAYLMVRTLAGWGLLLALCGGAGVGRGLPGSLGFWRLSFPLESREDPAGREDPGAVAGGRGDAGAAGRAACPGGCSGQLAGRAPPAARCSLTPRS